MESFSFTELKNTIFLQIFSNRMDSIKTGIPALLFTVQTNLVYLAISNLDAAVFQVTSQVKILTTALFMVVLLNKSLRFLQWIALCILCIGVSIIQIQNVKSSKNSDDDQKNAIFGLFCIVLACVLSGLAGVFLKKFSKTQTRSQYGLGTFSLVYSGLSSP